MPSLTYSDFEKHFSSQRLQRYLTAYAGDTNKAIQLYKANLSIAQAFHPLICLFEVILRNQINTILSAYFADPDWVLNERTGFMSDYSLNRSRFFLRSEVDNTLRRLTGHRYTPVTGKVIADLNFGFWTALFQRHHYTLIGGRVIRIFTNLPPTFGRSAASTNLDLIRDLRNRINHNEPICFQGTAVDFTKAIQTYAAIRRTLRWIDPDLLPLFKEFDSVLESISRAKSI